jgi:hypothetical protein
LANLFGYSTDRRDATSDAANLASNSATALREELADLPKVEKN